METGILRKLSKSSEMSFVYAFFFEFGDQVFVKVGRSVKPYRRLQTVAQAVPFQISEAVFCASRSIKQAESFERRVAARLKAFHARGEWYVFAAENGKVFSNAVRDCYQDACSRPLKWTRIDLGEFAAEQKEAASKWKFGGGRKIRG